MTEAVSTVAVGSPCSEWSGAEQSLYPTDRAKVGDESVLMDGVGRFNYELDSGDPCANGFRD